MRSRRPRRIADVIAIWAGAVTAAVGIVALLGVLWNAATERQALRDEIKHLREDVSQLQAWYGVADMHAAHAAAKELR